MRKALRGCQDLRLDRLDLRLTVALRLADDSLVAALPIDFDRFVRLQTKRVANIFRDRDLSLDRQVRELAPATGIT